MLQHARNSWNDNKCEFTSVPIELRQPQMRKNIHIVQFEESLVDSLKHCEIKKPKFTSYLHLWKREIALR